MGESPLMDAIEELNPQTSQLLVILTPVLDRFPFNSITPHLSWLMVSRIKPLPFSRTGQSNI